MSPNSGAQRIVPIDEVEMGAGNLVFRDIVELRKKDAKAQEGIVDVIATVLEQSCTNNDSLQVSIAQLHSLTARPIDVVLGVNSALVWGGDDIPHDGDSQTPAIFSF